MRVLVWSDDDRGARLPPEARELHPGGVAATVAQALRAELDADAVMEATGLHDDADGLPPERLARSNVLVWWGHLAHAEVDDATVERVHAHVLGGLGLVVLHSGHHAKVFRRLMGTSCDLRWREGDDRELIWTVDPAHPIADGVEQPIVLGHDEMYGEPFDVPAPDALVFISAFSGGEVFRSGCCYHRGAGRIFYFSVGHETLPVYDHPSIRRVLANGVRWAAATRRTPLIPRDMGPSRPRWQRATR